MRRIGAAVAVLVLAGATLGTAASTAGAAPAEGSRAAAACPTGWGSGAKGGAAVGADHLEDIRTGQHECYDRIVFDVPGGGDQISYHVQYVDRFYADPSGEYIPVAGGAILDIRVGAWSYDLEAGAPTYPGQMGEAPARREHQRVQHLPGHPVRRHLRGPDAGRCRCARPTALPRGPVGRPGRGRRGPQLDEPGVVTRRVVDAGDVAIALGRETTRRGPPAGVGSSARPPAPPRALLLPPTRSPAPGAGAGPSLSAPA